MTSSATQFAPSRRMDILDPIHQMNMWEDTFEGDISPNTGVCMIAQADTTLDDKSDYAPQDSLRNNQSSRSNSDKAQRRLEQNREAARKSRMKKKAYVQQLETSRLKLAQLELELERVKQQASYLLGSANKIGFSGRINSGIAAFEIKYGHWVEEQQRKIDELRNALQSPISELELHIIVDNFLNHYYDLFRMKMDAARADVFYLVSGMWRTSVERFFLWIGGFRPSELINVVMPHLDTLTDQQLVDICNLRLSCQQAEEALSQGMEKLQQSLVQSISAQFIPAGFYGSHINSAVEKLEAMELFVNQADHLRQQTLRQMSRILTTQQAARGLLAFGEYFERLRALSSLWAARPRNPT